MNFNKYFFVFITQNVPKSIQIICTLKLVT